MVVTVEGLETFGEATRACRVAARTYHFRYLSLSSNFSHATHEEDNIHLINDIFFLDWNALVESLGGLFHSVC